MSLGRQQQEMLGIDANLPRQQQRLISKDDHLYESRLDFGVVGAVSLLFEELPRMIAAGPHPCPDVSR